SGTRSSRSHRSSSKLSATTSSSRHMPFIVPSTRTKSPQRKLQEGQAIVLIALLILVLFGMLGLAIDSGRGYVDSRDQQTAIVAPDTQFHGYQFKFTTNHQLPLAFIQIFGGSRTVGIGATATSIVGNQRQTPALLTLSTETCATNLSGSAQLTVLGDVYTNGT